MSGSSVGMQTGVRKARADMTWQQKLTLAVIITVIFSVVFFKVDITISAFLGAALLPLAGVGPN